MKPYDDILSDAEVSRRPSVQLDCTRFRRSDALTLWKNRLIVGLGVATIALGLWWWVSGLWHGGNSPEFSPGPVASAHAAWETQCTVCHAPHDVAAGNWGAQMFGVSHTPDARCNACHSQETAPGSGEFATYAPHHANAIAADTPTCAACHLEHRGRDTDLNNVADRFCTNCHAKLSDRHKVADWSSHPPTHIDRDPGQLKFNHDLHLRAGIGRIDGSMLKRWNDIPETDRDRLGGKGKSLTDPVQLMCAACHETESDRVFKDAVAPSRASGALMLPIAYDRHCKVCHPTSVGAPGDPRGPIDVPHGIVPDKLAPLIEGLVIARKIDEAKKAGAGEPPWSLPGPEKEKFKRSIRDDVVTVEKSLLTSRYCGECHIFSDPAGTIPFAKQKLEPTKVPELWFPHARFDHAAHRMLDCLVCHNDMAQSKTSATIGIPNLDNCKQCHGTATDNSVRATCVTCHTYHNGDHPRSGMGARARMPIPAKADIEQFLKPAK